MPIYLNFTSIFQLSSTYIVNSSLIWNSSPLHVMGTDTELLITKTYTHSSPCHFMERSSKLYVLATFSPVPNERRLERPRESLDIAEKTKSLSSTRNRTIPKLSRPESSTYSWNMTQTNNICIFFRES